MAVAPTALLLRPLPSLDHQPSIASVSTASLGGSSSSHGSFSLFLHHRRPQSFRLAISRITPVEENVDEEEESSPAPPIKRSARNPPPWEQKNAPRTVSDKENPPWLKESSNVTSGDASHTYRAAPWQQGSPYLPRSPGQGAPWQRESFAEYPGENDRSSAHLTDAAADKSAMARIVEKLRHIQKTRDPADREKAGNIARNGAAEYKRGGQRGSRPGTRAPAQMGRYATEGSNKRAQSEQKRATTRSPSSQLNNRTVANYKSSTMQTKTVSDAESDGLTAKFPWEKDEEAGQNKNVAQSKKRGPRVPTLAELTLPREELTRLRLLGLQLDERLRVGKLGVTRNIVIGIREQFRSSELVKVRCEGPAAASIKKTQLELEEKTGGLVVLRTGKIIVIYRGSGYKLEQRNMGEGLQKKVEDVSSPVNRVDDEAENPLPDMINQLGQGLQQDASSHDDSEMGRAAMTPISSASADFHWRSEAEAEAQAEAESILEGLGPRYENWTGLLPVPVDADLLPAVIPNYRPPFRLMPYGIKPRISDSELTNLRQLARPIAPHFVLGRNRGHQGLAAAMVKLWEKSEVAKVAVKKRIQNTNNLIMAEELRGLTGGVLLSRDKFFLTFYRGKDFVPERVAAALVEREASVRDLQELEEKAREERSIPVKWTPYVKPSIAVIGEGAPAVTPSWVDTMDVKEQERLKREALKLQRTTLAHQLEKKLGLALRKKKKAEDELRKLNVFFNPIDRPIDVETITEEERFMFRKLGLKMKAYLLIGRRGVFDGVVENMHLHWKHRELVKIVVKEVNMTEVQDVARILEYESGGILVAVTPTRKGQAIIMYRGKNYQRPLELKPRNLLTKRKALKKSLELQRRESLSINIKGYQDQILDIRAELRKLGDMDGADEFGWSQGLDNRDQNPTSLGAQSEDLPSTSEKDDTKSKDRKETELTEDRNFFQEKVKQLEKLVRSGPLYRADPLSNSERLELRKEALSSGRAPQFFVGKNNGLEGLARGLRIYFLHHDLVTIVVKGRGPEMQIEDVIHELEDLTGGVLVSREANKIIMYRGWPKGFSPFAESLGNITPELLKALESEEVWENDSGRDYMISGEVHESDGESELEEDDDDEFVRASMLLSDGGSEYESDKMAVWEDIEDGSDEDSSWEEEDDDDNDEVEGSGGQEWANGSSGDLRLKLGYDSEDNEEDDDGNELEEEDDDEDEEEDKDQESSWDVRAKFDDNANEDKDEDEEDDDEEGSDEDSSCEECSLSGLQFADGIFEESSNQKLTYEGMESW